MKKVLNLFLLVLLVLLLGAAVALFGGILPEYALPVYALVGLLIATWGLKWLLCRPVSWVWSPMHLPALLFWGYTLVWHLYSPIRSASRVDIFHITMYTSVYLAVANNLYRSRDRITILIFLVIIAAAESGYAFWQYHTGDNQVLWLNRGLDYPGRGGGTYYCPNHLAGLLELILGWVAAGLIIYRPSSDTIQNRFLRWWFGLALIVLMGLGLFSTLSRGGWFSMIATIPIFLILGERTRAISSKVAIGCFAILVLLAGILWNTPSIRSRVEQSVDINLRYRLGESPILVPDGFGGRVPFWRATIGMIRDNPILGTGPGTWQWSQLKYREPNSPIHPEYAHNDFLQLVSEYGTVGAGLICALFAAFYWQGIKLVRSGKTSEQSACFLGAMTAVTAILIHSWMDFNFHIPANSLIVAVLLGIVAAQGTPATGDEWRWRSPVPRGFRYGLAILLLAIGTALGAFGFSRWFVARTNAQAYDAAQLYDWDEALRLYKRALKVDGNSPEIYSQMGDLYRSQSLLITNEDLQLERQFIARRAVANYHSALLYNPYNSDIILRMAGTYELAADKANAARWYDRALEVDPNNSFAWLRLGSFHLRQGDTNQAIADWQQAQRLNPADGTAPRRLKTLKP